MNTNFYSLWFDPTGNRTQVYRFSSRRSIHSTTDLRKIFRKRILGERTDEQEVGDLDEEVPAQVMPAVDFTGKDGTN